MLCLLVINEFGLINGGMPSRGGPPESNSRYSMECLDQSVFQPLVALRSKSLSLSSHFDWELTETKFVTKNITRAKSRAEGFVM
ncbi:MAG: hypothetical protein CL921_01355 [Deltaproteobacteria bacterium]|nr:hypothetical protein [Deltaproteobacteria bacterium]